jgi:hypothetical protein
MPANTEWNRMAYSNWNGILLAASKLKPPLAQLGGSNSNRNNNVANNLQYFFTA